MRHRDASCEINKLVETECVFQLMEHLALADRKWPVSFLFLYISKMWTYQNQPCSPLTG